MNNNLVKLSNDIVINLNNICLIEGLNTLKVFEIFQYRYHDNITNVMKRLIPEKEFKKHGYSVYHGTDRSGNYTNRSWSSQNVSEDTLNKIIGCYVEFNNGGGRMYFNLSDYNKILKAL